MTKYALLDYDGFICKAWFASQAHGRTNDNPELILTKLVMKAIEKAEDYFGQPVRVLPFASGHSYKKDLYDTYKEHREKSDELGKFRDYILSEYKVFRSVQLEADDLISLCVSYLECDIQGKNYIVFSDDKDLQYISRTCCKINLTSKIFDNPTPCCSSRKLMCQLLAGDKEDDIEGIPKMGMKTADKILPKFAGLHEVFKVYKDKGLSMEHALKNVILVMPLLMHTTNNFMDGMYVANKILVDNDSSIDEDIVEETIKSQKEFLTAIAEGVYNNGKK